MSEVENPYKIATVTLATLLLAMGAMWGMVSVHADHPHAGVVTEQVFQSHNSAVDRSLDSIQRQISTMDAKLDKVLQK